MSAAWSDTIRLDKIADPMQAMKDAREAHAWVTRELQGAKEPIRIYNLDFERKRLAGIVWELKRLYA